MARFIGNDPTGNYQGKFQGKPRKQNRHRHGRRGKKRFSTAPYETSSGTRGKMFRPSSVPTMPDRGAWQAAQASNDFWARVKPKAQISGSKEE